MANHYTQFSFAIPLETDEQRLWVEQAIAYIEAVRNEEREPVEGDDFYAVLSDDPEFSTFGAEVDEDGLWIHSEDVGAPGDTVPLIQEFLTKFDPDGRVGFEWADVCSRPILDAFGGGAVVITADETKWMSSGQWLFENMKVD